jgi:type II secretory pathway pseudopilin PulG
MNLCIKKKGTSLIEVIIASAIISLSTISTSVVYGNLVSLSTQNTAKVQAAFLLDEGVEAIKSMRGDAWSNIASTTSGTTNYFLWTTNKWKATTTPSMVDNIFTRTFIVSAVNRDTNLNISTSTGTNDAGTKKVDITVSWFDTKGTSTHATSMYIFNLYE